MSFKGLHDFFFFFGRISSLGKYQQCPYTTGTPHRNPLKKSTNATKISTK